MKSLLIAAVLMLSALTTKTFANDVRVTPKVLESFRSSFKKAADIEWTLDGGMYRADFTVKGKRKIAFFDMKEGELIVTCEYISITDLPEELQESLQEHTANATLKELFVVQSDDVPDYYATIKQDDKTTILKGRLEKWSVFKRK